MHLYIYELLKGLFFYYADGCFLLLMTNDVFIMCFKFERENCLHITKTLNELKQHFKATCTSGAHFDEFLCV